MDVGATVGKTVNDLTQIVTPGGYSKGFQSSTLSHKTDIYNGLNFPEQDFSGMIPSDLMNPQIELQATEEQLTKGLQTYAGGVRAQQLLQASFGYIEEIGKTAQRYHKSKIAAIKSATLGVKAQSEIVGFDIANVELDINREKLAQSDQKLVQAKITTTHFKNETEQLRLFYEATERKKEIQIRVLDSQSQDVMQKYLSKSMQGGI
ncbi:MAG: hypothetical protein HWQ41_00485 [Nostoc sp. NOS(2021)]|uniref:hypothetical protein n=1 Tax=Nostoc sp. NOS(2021) TaxID=2815407 RepID=UPI0025CD12BD|nr:hypothetical protein [Nostoc sp. NOS(2021)]MBN3893821.1 hypothetical protein [Nostoc sp. NOS(2021)]